MMPWGFSFSCQSDLLTIYLEQKIKISNYNLDLREVPHSFLTELLPTLPFALLKFILFHTGALESFEKRTNLPKIFQHLPSFSSFG